MVKQRIIQRDWNQFKQWFQQQESSLKNIHTDIKNEKIKRDVNRSYEIAKKVWSSKILSM